VSECQLLRLQVFEIEAYKGKEFSKNTCGIMQCHNWSCSPKVLQKELQPSCEQVMCNTFKCY
jgi:hypothetical protein